MIGMITTYTLEVPDEDYVRVVLDELDRHVIFGYSPTPIADVLLALQTLALRLEQQGK